MKLKFTWEKTGERLSPYCASTRRNNDGISLLASLLMDDGGRNYSQTIAWIDEGIITTDAILNGEILTGKWDREAWGAKLKSNKVKIYSLHSDDYTEEIAPSTFRYALVAWKDFIQSSPDINAIREIEI